MTVLIDALAVYRLWRLASSDLITEPVRRRLYTRLGRGSYLEALISCPWCLGFWIALAVIALRRWLPAWDYAARALAASALAGGYDALLERLDRPDPIR